MTATSEGQETLLSMSIEENRALSPEYSTHLEFLVKAHDLKQDEEGVPSKEATPAETGFFGSSSSAMAFLSVPGL